jgi:hypothetical protein
MKLTFISLAALTGLALAGCTPPAAKAPEAPAVAEAPAPAAVILAADGPAGTQASVPNMEREASVGDVFFMKENEAKIFTTVGGDPAINGLYTYLAVIGEEQEYTVYQLGDFNDVKVVSEKPGEIGLKISKSEVEQASGDIKTADHYLLITVPKPGDKTVTITPAKVQ